MLTDNEIINALLKRRRDGVLQPNEPSLEGDIAPLTEATVAYAEERLGFRLPLLLRRIYTEVANGGFGDSYGFLGLVGGPVNEDGLDAVSLYLSYRQVDPDDEHWSWPHGLLPLGYLGCAMYRCVKCDEPAAPIVWYEPNQHEDGQPWEDAFFPFCSSLNEYLSAWLR